MLRGAAQTFRSGVDQTPLRERSEGAEQNRTAESFRSGIRLYAGLSPDARLAHFRARLAAALEEVCG